MTRYLVRRVMEMVITVIASSIVIFGILNLAPGGPFDALVAGRPIQDPTYLDRLNKLVGLDKPAHERYLTWASGVIRGDLGESWVVSKGRPVSTLIGERIGNTFKLTIASLSVSLILALAIGIASAIKQYSWFDYAATAFSFAGTSLPAFWFGLMMIFIFGLWLRVLPISGIVTVGRESDVLDQLRYLVMPVAVLSLLNVAQWSRFVRSSMLEVMRQDYVRTARAKGLAARAVLFRHTLRNALIPLITIVAITVPSLLGGAIITETIFSWPGLGRLLFDSVTRSDWPVAMGLLLLSSAMVVLGNFIADLLYAVVDPRIRYS